jgi:GTP cyclohydrolase II
MNHLPLRDQASPVSVMPSAPDEGALRARSVHRAAAELRRGTPVVLLGPAPLLVLPAETAGAQGLRDIASLAAGPAVLLLAPSRAAAVLQRPVGSERAAVAIRLAGLLTDPAVLRGVADPTAQQLLPDDPLPTEPPELAAAALELAKLARLLPAVIAAPAVAEGGAMRGLVAVEAADVLAYPDAAARAVVRVAEAAVPMEGAEDARVVAFRAPDSGIEHLAILVGRPERASAPLVRLHSECFTGDLLASLRCDCGAQLKGAIRRMGVEGAGVLIYLAQEGRGIGLVNKLRAYAMQDRGLDTLDANRALGWGADERNFLTAATMLENLGIRRVRLLTNNPGKMAALAACGIEVVSRESHAFAPNGVNDQYLATKARRFGHLFD